MPFASKRQARMAFARKLPFAKRWAKQTDFAALPESKDAGSMPGAMIGGPGGLLATPGMGGKPRKWGNRKKLKGCTCGVSIATKEQIAPGVMRIRGNLCNVHGRYGPCDASQSGKKRGAGKGRKPKKAAKPKLTPEQRTAARAKQQAENRAKTLAGLGIAPDGQAALEALRAGQQADPAVLARGGFEKAGLVERAADGSFRLSASGRAMLNAANQGDQGRAGDTISAARNRTAAREQRQTAAQQRKQAADERRKQIEAGYAKRDAARAQRQRSRGSSAAPATRGTHVTMPGAPAPKPPKAAAPKRQAPQQQPKASARQTASRQARLPKVDTSRPGVHTPFHKRGPRSRAINVGTIGKSMRYKASNPGDYLIVEDRTKPTTWHLQVRKNGKPDHGLMGSAWAALHSGFRGNVYSGPNKGEAIAKLRKLYKAEKMDIPAEKSFVVFKSADGSYRWIARSTTAYRDRDGEIITTKALDDDAERMNATQQFGPLRYWHLGEPNPFDPVNPAGPGVDIGDCDYSILIGRTSIESGTFKSAALGKAFADSADDYELSPGFFHPPAEPNAAGEYHHIRRFERSVVPIKYGRASNLFTGLTVKDHTMDQQTYEARVKAFMADMHAKGVPPEAAAASLAGMEQADKSATAQGIAYKSDDPWAAVTAALKAAVMSPAVAAAAAPPAEDKAAGDEASEDPAMEDTPEDQAQDEGNYLGDMNVADFEAMLSSALQTALAPLVKGIDISGKMAQHMSELKDMMGGYATKDDSRASEIATLKAEQEKLTKRLAELEGDQPAMSMKDVQDALTSKPADPPTDKPQIPNDPNRPFAGWAAQTWPELFNANNS